MMSCCVLGKTLAVAGPCEVADSRERFSKALQTFAASRPVLLQMCAAWRGLPQIQIWRQRLAAPLPVAAAPVRLAAQKLVRTLVIVERRR